MKRDFNEVFQVVSLCMNTLGHLIVAMSTFISAISGSAIYDVLGMENNTFLSTSKGPCLKNTDAKDTDSSFLEKGSI